MEKCVRVCGDYTGIYIYCANRPQLVFIPFCDPWRTTCTKLLCYTWTLIESICFSVNNCWHLHTRTASLLFSINLGRLRSGLSVCLSFFSLSLILWFLPPFLFLSRVLGPHTTLPEVVHRERSRKVRISSICVYELKAHAHFCLVWMRLSEICLADFWGGLKKKHDHIADIQLGNVWEASMHAFHSNHDVVINIFFK